MTGNLIRAMLLVLLTSCTTMESPAPVGGAPASTQAVSAPTQPAPVRTVDASAPLSGSATELAASAQTSQQRARPTIYRGNDQHLRVPEPAAPVAFLGEDVSLNFEDAPLAEVTHAILGEILALDYVVDRPIEGNVTLRTRTPVPRDQLLGVLESLLKSNGSLLIRGSEGRYLVTGAQGAVVSPRVSNADDRLVGYSTIVVPLRYISASDMAEILQPVAEESAFVRVDNSRNILMLAGTQAQLAGWLDIVSTFDVDQLKGMSVGLFPLENSDVEEVAEALTTMLAGGEESDLVRVIPVRRLNSVLLVTPRAHFLDTLGTWIERLDSAPDARFEKKLHVYPVQNTDATRLAELLNGIYAGGGGVGRGAGGGGIGRTGSIGGVAPGLSTETIGTGSASAGGGGSIGSAGSVGGNTGNAQGQKQSISAVSMAGGLADGQEPSPLEDVRIVADDENNALMVYATGKQFEIILAALKQLDVVATQVIIEASIIEVTLTDDLRYGLEWTFKNGIGDDYDGKGVWSSTAPGPASLLPGFSYTVTNSVGDISAVLNALSEESLLNIISTPSVMVLDNHTAFIHVGDQVPVLDQSTVSDGGNSTQSISYRDTGVKLTVTPSVNAGGLVTMEVEQSVTDVGPPVNTTGQNTFLERNIRSRVAVRSNESVVLGGLIRDNAKNAESGVPFLHKLPIVGPIFGKVDKEDKRTELLVIITPRALYNSQELREVSDEMRSRIRHLELIEVAE